MKKILGTGLSGMLGSCITDVLHDRYEFHDLSYDTGIDIRYRDLLTEYVSKFDADIILHLAAKTDVDACELDKQEDLDRLKTLSVNESTVLNSYENIRKINWQEWKEVQSAFSINVIGTLNIAEICKKLGKKMIFVSTDFVFSGDKEGLYTEEDIPFPKNFYAQTKYWGEQIVKETLEDYIIIRIAYPYGTNHEVKKDFVRIIRERLAQGQKVVAIEDNIITPTYSPDITKAIDYLISHEIKGHTFHVVGSEHISSYKTAVEIARKFGYDTRIIQKTSSQEYYQNRAVRPCHLAISNDKITKRGIHMSKFTEGIHKIQ